MKSLFQFFTYELIWRADLSVVEVRIFNDAVQIGTLALKMEELLKLLEQV